jgi:adenine phosphoribosyltransferase
LVTHPAAFQAAINLLARRYASSGITHVLACEARGYIVAAPLALALGVPFVTVRKQHKLPGETVSARASRSTYVTAHLEMHKGSMREGDVGLIVDDVIGSGATLLGMAELVGESLSAEAADGPSRSMWFVCATAARGHAAQPVMTVVRPPPPSLPRPCSHQRSARA